MSKHTPGPWVFSETNIGRDFNVGYGIYTDRSGWSLVHVPTSDPEDGGSAEANARLIAAAPDLLEAALMAEALETRHANCLDCEGEGDPEACDTCFPVADRARLARRAAIAKAEGRS